MIKIRSASAIAAGAVAALAIGGTAALAAGAGDPAPGRSSGGGFSVPMAPDGDPLAAATADDDSTRAPAPSSSAPSSSASSSSVPSSSVPSSSASFASVPPARSELSISVDLATSIAVRVAGGGQVIKLEGEFEHGRAVWDVDVLVDGVEHDIDVDRATGTVIRHRIKAADLGRGDDHGGDDNGSGGHGSDD
jgi:uncharacterized membrane protein YkoI